MSSWSTWERCPPGDALREADPEVASLIEEEIARQNDGIELIASENFVSPGVLEAMGSPLTNKYAEGLPGKRYYGGCEVVDKIEQLAIDRAKQLFGADHANVQPHSGAQANAAVFLAFMKPGDTFLGMDLSQGGHLTHGSPVYFSGLLYKAVSYGLDDDGYIDMERPFGYRGQELRTYQQRRETKHELEAVNHFAAQMDHFAECILNDEEPLTPGEEGLKDHPVMAAIEEAAATGRRVRV